MSNHCYNVGFEVTTLLKVDSKGLPEYVVFVLFLCYFTSLISLGKSIKGITTAPFADPCHHECTNFCRERCSICVVLVKTLSLFCTTIYNDQVRISKIETFVFFDRILAVPLSVCREVLFVFSPVQYVVRLVYVGILQSRKPR